jgi:hypothetical protein
VHDAVAFFGNHILRVLADCRQQKRQRERTLQGGHYVKTAHRREVEHESAEDPIIEKMWYDEETAASLGVDLVELVQAFMTWWLQILIYLQWSAKCSLHLQNRGLFCLSEIYKSFDSREEFFLALNEIGQPLDQNSTCVEQVHHDWPIIHMGWWGYPSMEVRGPNPVAPVESHGCHFLFV